MTARVEPGDVLVSTWGCHKARPWLVIWVDDVDEAVCVAAFTKQAGYCGTARTGIRAQENIAAWAMVQPLHMAQNARTIARLGAKTARRLARLVHKNLDLV